MTTLRDSEAASMTEARAELDRRAAAKNNRQKNTERLTDMARAGETRAQRVLTDKSVEALQRIRQATGLKVEAQRLEPAQLDELLLHLWPRVKDGEHRGDERARFEALCEKAADMAGVFEERRSKAKETRDLARLKEKAHVARLPRRQKYEEPGAITLPRVAFSWLQNSRGQWSVTDVGTLAVLLSMFEEKRSLVRDANFEEDDDGQRVLVCTGTRERLRFLPSVDPGLGAASTSGEVKLDAALTRLGANRWLDVKRVGRHRTEVRLGERALKLREPSEA